MTKLFYISIFLGVFSVALADEISISIAPGTTDAQKITGITIETSSSEKFVANSDNRYDVYDYIMSEFRKDDFEPIKSTVTNYDTGSKLNVNFTVGCRDGEYIVMGLKPDAHVLVWENPNENPDTCIANF